MLFIHFFLILLASAFPIDITQSADLTQSLEFKIISSNVRTDTIWRFYHEKKWHERKDDLINRLLQHSSDKPTLIGLQELKHNQVEDLYNGLNSVSLEWLYYGVGRDDGKTNGEYAPIFYRNSQWEFINGTTRWLSETPEVPSKSWDAANIRIVTITTFKNKETGVHINMLNTHYDHKSELARGKSSELILNWIDQIPNDYETFLSGDFNSFSSDLSYQTLIKQLMDTRELAQDIRSNLDTYTGFEPEIPNTVIDFVWCSKSANGAHSKTVAKSYDVKDTWTEKGFRYSDHRLVVTEFLVKQH